MRPLFCHVGVVDITPSQPVHLDGYANRVGLSGQVHRPLTSRCLVLSDGQSRLCLIVNDLCELALKHVSLIRDAIQEATNLDRERVLIHNIHTHSAPAMGSMLPAINEADRRYREAVRQNIADNAIGLLTDEDGFRPCQVRWGSVSAGIGINRRSTDPETGTAVIGQDADGATDEEVAIVQFADQTGVLATVFNYACHPVTLGYESTVVSPDYCARAREVVEEAWGGVAIFLNGAAGDVNPVNGLQTDPTVTDAEGQKLGEAILRADLQSLGDRLELRHATTCAQLPYRDQDMSKEWIEQEVERKQGQITEFKNWPRDVRTWADGIIEKIEAGEIGGERSMRLAVVRIGPVVLFFSQGEIFVDYQVALKRFLPDYNLLFVGYTNGESGYLPTPDAFQQGGYEVDQSYIYLREPSPLTDQAPAIFMERAQALIKSVCRVCHDKRPRFVNTEGT